MRVIPLYQKEKTLIKRAAQGDRKAQRMIYEQHSPKMLSVCRMYVKDLQFAEDVLLRGFFKVFKYLPDFQHKGSFEGWIRRIMVREAIDFLRAKKELEFREDMAEEMKLSMAPDNYGEEVAYIQQLIDELPEGYKVVFIMAAIEGYKHKEIAEMLSITEGTSKSQLARARKMLQEKLNDKKNLGYGI